MIHLACRAACFLLALSCGAPTAAAQAPARWTGGATPALALDDMGGRRVRLEEFRGKVVLINFWATWCEPCREEIPSFQLLKQKLAGRPFEVLAVNLAEPRSRVEAFLGGSPLDFPVLLDPQGDASRRWRARVLPVTYILGPDGRIRYSHVGDLDWAAPRIVELITAMLPAR